ncbi:MAG: DNA double-strand break repair protein Mre11 [Euryarchaeota archaeon]|nr:DNA double-strand break repair protein Mre11 [Euryarchaeota archaeon]
MTRVIHTGDTHIGYQQYHSAERRQDFLDAFEQVVDDAIEMDVAALVHAGDLFHDRRPELPDLLGTLNALRRLAGADIPFLAVVGNHESTRGGQWLDLFERLDLATRLGSEPVMVDSAAIYGLDHVPVSRREDLDYEFTPPSDDVTQSVLVSHGLFTPFAHANWETETVLAESNIDFDAVLLGDNHEAGIEQVDETWVTYCGSTERASASERDGRGYNVVEFGDEPGPSGVDIRQRSVKTRPFVFVSVDLAEGEGSSRVREQVRQYDLDEAVVSVEILGDGDPVTPASIEEFALDRGALVARVTDRREIETETELSVSFADPDAAVDEKIRELELSETALDIDETVRASKLADSNVREAVSQLVEHGVEDESADPADDPVSDDQPEAESETAGDKPTDEPANEPATDGQLSLEDLQ